MLKKYSKYKDSGIDWIGPIPTHWETIRTRFVLKTISGNGFPEDLQGKKEGEYPFYKCSDINTAVTFVDDANNYVDSDDVAKNKWDIIAKNSILLAKIGEALKKNHRKINRRDCLIDNNMMALSIRSQSISLTYLYYLMMLIRMEWFVNPGAVPSVDVNKFRSFRIPELPQSEQVQIEAFLDDKTAKIDDLIAKKERMIELLKEERAAVINQAVTKGLDPKVEMQDSGIEWLGGIPKNWAIKRLKYVGRAIIGLTYAPEDVFPDGILVLRSSNVQDGQITFDDNVYVNKPIKEELFVKEGDILLCSRNGSRALIGKCARINNEHEGSTFGAFMTVFRGKANRFVFYVFNSTIFSFHIGSFLTATINQLTTENLNSIVVALPPENEQKAIADYLDVKTAQIDGQIALERRLIELLKEYRTALISEAVTGKIDVRGE